MSSHINLDQLPSCISEGKRICLQLPDALLSRSEEVVETLVERLPGSKVSVLADSCMADCCVDFLSASHLDADFILKIGAACSLEDGEVPCFRARPEWESCPQLLSAHLRTLGDVHPGVRINIVSEFCLPSEMMKLTSHVRSLSFAECCSQDLDHEIIVAVDLDDWMANFITLVHRSGTVYRWDGAQPREQSPSKLLSKRFSALSRFKASSSVGVLVRSTSSISADLAARLARLLRGRGHPSYVVNMGRLNEAKLGNFPDIDIWVVVGCPRAIFDTMELGYCLLTPFELLCAMGMYTRFLSCITFRYDFWSVRYVLDSRTLLSTLASGSLGAPEPDGSCCEEQTLALRDDFSMISVRSKVFHGVSPGRPDEVEECFSMPGQILSGQHGVPRSYVNT